jgi:pimeloyl-ACP methyl ester carboxylesterase
MNKMSYIPSLVVTAIAMAMVSNHGIPILLKWRDDGHPILPIRTKEELAALGVCRSGTTRIQLSPATIDRLVSTNPEWQQRHYRPVDTVLLHYLTTRGPGCGSDVLDDEGHNEPTNADQSPPTTTTTSTAPRRKKDHVLLVHGTGISSMAYTNTYENDRGKDDTGSSSTPSLWNLFRQAGYDVTAVDLRGHGLSEITNGPYSVELLAADVAALIRELFPPSSDSDDTAATTTSDDERVHCCGLSVGFGVCMALALHEPDLVVTASGNGFLFDRTNRDWKAWLFSRPMVSRFLGMTGIGLFGQVAINVQKQPNLFRHWMKHTHVDGFIATASGWLSFDLSWALPTLQVPTLFLLPQYDQDLGHTVELTRSEIARMPPGMGHLLEFEGHSHCMLGEPGGRDKIASAVLSFIQQHSGKSPLPLEEEE